MTGFRVNAFSAQSLRPLGVVRSALDAFKTVAGGRRVLLLDPRSKIDRWVSADSLDDATLVELSDWGGLSARTDDFECSCRVFAAHFASAAKLQEILGRSGFIQNGFSITVSESTFTGLDTNSFVRALESLIAAAEPYYAYGFDAASEYVLNYESALGPAGGPRDVYPLNYFGAPFVQLLGRDALLALPAEVARGLGEGVLVQPLKGLWGFDLLEMKRARQLIRERIGEDHFARGIVRKGSAEVRSIFGIVPALLSEWRQNRRAAPAMRVPEIDWSALAQPR